MKEFKLDGHEYIELKNLLKLVGLCETGGQAMIVIAEGLVRVDGKVELRKRCKIKAGQHIVYEGDDISVTP